jgi:hypothetical protein
MLLNFYHRHDGSHTVDGPNNTIVLITNNNESNEVAHICCARPKIKLENTLTELKSMQKIVKLLQNELKLICINRE